MKTFLATLLTTAVLAAPAMAECDAPFPLSMFEEKADGTNCEATAFEKGAGDLLAALAIFVAAGEMMGADIVGPNSATAGLGG